MEATTTMPERTSLTPTVRKYLESSLKEAVSRRDILSAEIAELQQALASGIGGGRQSGLVAESVNRAQPNAKVKGRKNIALILAHFEKHPGAKIGMSDIAKATGLSRSSTHGALSRNPHIFIQDPSDLKWSLNA
jgi:hypothetical protein